MVLGRGLQKSSGEAEAQSNLALLPPVSASPRDAPYAGRLRLLPRIP